jgi:hypothetical protein
MAKSMIAVTKTRPKPLPRQSGAHAVTDIERPTFLVHAGNTRLSTKTAVAEELLPFTYNGPVAVCSGHDLANVVGRISIWIPPGGDATSLSLSQRPHFHPVQAN